MKYSADELYDYLVEKYQVPENISKEEERKFLSLSTECSDKNLMILSLIDILEKNNETLNDDLPISETKPYEFSFNGNNTQEVSWKKSVGMKEEQYKRIAGIETDEEAEEMLEELIDRFGEPPKSVQNLLTIARLKAVAHSVYIKEIVQREDLLKILMYEKAKIHAQRIPELVKEFAPSLKFAADPKGPYFTYRLGANSREKNREILEVLRQLLEQMHVFLCAEP